MQIAEIKAGLPAGNTVPVSGTMAVTPPATWPLPTDAATETTLALVKTATQETAARGRLATPPVLDYTASAWDGAAARKIAISTGTTPVRLEQLHLTGGGAGGGCATYSIYLCPVGATPTTEYRIAALTQAVGDALTMTPVVPIILRPTAGEYDVWVIPDVGTTAKKLTLEVSAV
jgi:hypothetical protein